GPSVPLPNLEKNFHPKEYPHYFDCKEWFSIALGRMGFPVTFKAPADKTAECFLLTEELCNELTPQEIKALVTRNLLLDGKAAEMLEQMGHGNTIGVSVSSPCPHFSMEVLDSNGINMRLLYSNECRLLKPLPGAKIISSLIKNPFAANTGKQTIGPGSLIYDNGKTKVASWAGYIDVYTVAPYRKEWLAQILPELCDIPAFCLNEQDIMMRCGIMMDNSVLAAIFNLSYDTLTDIALQCKSKPSSALELLPDGSWREMPFTYQDGRLNLPGSTCQPYRPIIIKLTA
ncbi:MAG: hypothetical protein IKS20_10820, partial [Victivallales bacterium]|nr:hypothetical protein [Victivallales bacterium]